ncbi:MAG TPA: ribosomal protein S18-alanine N-acetyltransferase [Candidatus Eremiobacteraceae bacterium]|nr:ribosomal protein S18-alanine N-acetyltransferase [Candidatus Eremiobacteraceae bacterium]
MHLRHAIAADIPAILDLERQSPSAAHWSRQQYENLFVNTGGQQCSQSFAWVIEMEGGAQREIHNETPKIAAFLVARRVDPEWELENIVVSGAARRRGMGTLLLHEFVENVGARGDKAIFLEVRESNQGARSLYRKLGFEEAGLRKNYYSDPHEDAIVCRLRVA